MTSQEVAPARPFGMASEAPNAPVMPSTPAPLSRTRKRLALIPLYALGPGSLPNSARSFRSRSRFMSSTILSNPTNPAEVSGDYWQQSRRPLASLAFVAPLLLLYEIGVLVLGAHAVRNGADVWLRQ